ncbi:ATP-binding protein [Paenibacillus sedimenti]|uniref:histidine kinase n=1 Tax=Paenibacillus sedimenti TaxID=2770274 RepID=A0A926KRC3_9BACL|nr:ATP-binding protein [Paenibacillus sedimenti]MBD0380888.1 ATP-binding protein [Paenibacillus sedimenti]
MLIEKLFLNILIVLAPTLVIIAFGEKWRQAQSAYVFGILQGVSSALSLLFAYQALHLFWDLRYVPLIISAIYGGPIAAAINYVIILMTRTYLGGNALLFGYISITLTFLALLFASSKVKGMAGNSRIKMTLFISLIPSVIMLLILISFTRLNKIPMDFDYNPVLAVIFFGIFQALAACLSAMLQEISHERLAMKLEIQKNEKMKTLGELAASIAHEVRNPLTVVKGFLQMMRPNESGKNQKYLDIALGELERTESIINDYLNFAKPKLTKMESFSLTDLLNNISALFTPMAGNSGILITADLQEDIIIHTDRGQLQQALINVVKNAVEATPTNGEVTIRLTCKESQAQIMIKDNGKGMTREQVSRIGTLFFSTKEVGTGLGTALAVRIIESMNGQITYDSKVGIGTKVTITVPLYVGGRKSF